MNIAKHSGPAVCTYYNPYANQSMNQYTVRSKVNGAKYSFNFEKGSTVDQVKSYAKHICSYFSGHGLSDMEIV